jgi:hypothetical protein
VGRPAFRGGLFLVIALLFLLEFIVEPLILVPDLSLLPTGTWIV